jgi:protein-tyrosine-phosphatase
MVEEGEMGGSGEDQPWVGFDHLVDRLSREFDGVLSRETVQRLLLETEGLLGESRVRTFLPILVERFARERLRALARTEGNLVRDTPEVLFVCVHNAGRSQMAAALLDHYALGRVHVRSAGSTPADQINPAAVRAMEEWEIDLSNEFPKPLTDEVVRDSDVVITMGCGDACPIYPGKRYLDWDLPDPAGKTVEEVRLIRDQIDGRVRQLLEELVPSEPERARPR